MKKNTPKNIPEFFWRPSRPPPPALPSPEINDYKNINYIIFYKKSIKNRLKMAEKLPKNGRKISEKFPKKFRKMFPLAARRLAPSAGLRPKARTDNQNAKISPKQ